jgi:hypothetical protein
MQRKQQDATECRGCRESNRMHRNQQDSTGCRESNNMQRKQQAVTLIQQDASGTDGYRMMHNAARYNNYSNIVCAEGCRGMRFNTILRKQQNATSGDAVGYSPMMQ